MLQLEEVELIQSHVYFGGWNAELCLCSEVLPVNYTEVKCERKSKVLIP